jgi:hypothetical protein
MGWSPREGQRRVALPRRGLVRNRVAIVVAPLVAACAPDLGLKAFNASPSAVISSHQDGDGVTSGLVIDLRGSGSDPDDGPSELSARWYVGSALVCGPEPLASDGLTTCAAAVGDDGTITLEISDPYGATASARVSLDVAEQEPPRAVIVAPTDDTPLWSDAPVLLHGTVSDAEDAPADLIVWWEDDVSGVRIDSVPEGDGTVYESINLDAGVHLLTLHVEDRSGLTATDAVTVEVAVPNAGPECAIVTPGDGSASPASPELEGWTVDPDDAASDLVVVWESDVDGVVGVAVPDSDGTVRLAAPSFTVGDHVLTMTVEDPHGGSCRSSVGFALQAPPGVVVTEPLDGAVVALGAPWTLAATVTDLDGAPDGVTARWSSSVDGDLGAAGVDPAGASVVVGPMLTPGAHTLTLEVVDPDGLAAADSVSIWVDQPPTAPTVTVSPDPATTLQDLVAVASGSVDPDGGSVSYRYAWFEDGALLPSYTSSTLPAAATTRDRSYTVEVTPFDGVSAGPIGSDVARVVNSAPSIVAVAVTPDPAVVTDTLTCVPIGYSDPDGDVDATRFAWTIGASAVGAASTLRGVFVAGDIVRCEATPFDGSDAGTPLVASVQIVNTPPVGTSVGIAPVPLRTDDVAAATPTGTDADGDPLTWSYAWTVDGVPAGGSGATLSGASFAYGQVVSVLATPLDAEGVGAPVASAPVVVANTAPTAPGLEITPADAMETLDDLTCEVAAPSFDADGHAVSYTVAWRRNGVPWVGAVETDHLTGDTIPKEETVLGQTWTCEVTPTDGIDDGPLASTSVTILPISCETEVVVWWDREVILQERLPDEPHASSFLVYEVTSMGLQSADAQLDDLEVRDAFGSVLYSDDFSSGAPWTICESWLANNTINGVADARNDWQFYALEAPQFDWLGGVYASVWANWGSATNAVEVHLTDSIDDCMGVVNYELGVTLQEYHIESGPDLAHATYGGSVRADAAWVQPATGWHELGVMWVDSCIREDDWDLDGDRSPRDADCDDFDPLVHPAAGDPLGDGVDADCDGIDG